MHNRNNYIRCFLNGEVTNLPIVKTEKWLSKDRMNYLLVETSDGNFYEIRKTTNGQLVAHDVTDL